MKTKNTPSSLSERIAIAKHCSCRTSSSGQALVEFTLCFMLLLVIAYIPADFGLAFYTSHIMGNAAREGARIGAADPGVDAQTGTCTLSACFALANGTLRREVAERMSSALMNDGQVTVSTSGRTTTCDKTVQVSVQGTYNFFFYRIIKWFGVNSAKINQPIVQTYTMRYDHQC